MKGFADRMDNIANVGAFAIWYKAGQLEAQGKDIVRLELGEPDYPTPEHIREAGVKAIRDGKTRYSASAGMLPLRSAIAERVTATRGVDVDPSQVVIAPGTKAAIYFTTMTVIGEGDEMLIPDMGFPGYDQQVQLAGGKFVYYSLKPENGFQPDSAEIASLITPRTKAIIFNSPHNPSGAIHNENTLKALAEVCIKNDLWVLSDEIYSEIYFTDNPPPSLYSQPGMAERTVLLDGFSKTYAMTGWRLGYGVYPPDFAAKVSTMTVNVHSNVPEFVQYAGIAALTGPQDCVSETRALFYRRRNLILEILDDVPDLRVNAPDGAFYVLLDVRQVGDGSSTGFADKMLDYGVSMLPADGFGPGGEGFVRVSLTQPDERLVEGMKRIVGMLKEG